MNESVDGKENNVEGTHETADAFLDASRMRQEGTHDASPGTLRGGHDAREMAQRRWEKRWEKQRARQEPGPGDTDKDEEAEADVRMVYTPIRIGRIVRALETEAVNGNAHAARELRAWLAEYPPQDDAITPEQLSRRTRQRLMARLIAELEEEDAANAKSSEDADDQRDRSSGN
jgi:hypothetical protein